MILVGVFIKCFNNTLDLNFEYFIVPLEEEEYARKYPYCHFRYVLLLLCHFFVTKLAFYEAESPDGRQGKK